MDVKRVERSLSVRFFGFEATLWARHFSGDTDYFHGFTDEN